MYGRINIGCTMLYLGTYSVQLHSIYEFMKGLEVPIRTTGMKTQLLPHNGIFVEKP